MRILLVIDSLGSGGAQRLFAHLAKELKVQGHDVDIFVYVKSDFYESEFTKIGVRIHKCYSSKKGFSFQVVRSLLNVLRLNFDKAIAGLHAPSIYLSLASLFFPNLKVTVCEFSSSFSKTSKIRKFLFYLSSLLASNVICNSYAEAKLMRNLPGRTNNLRTILNGYNIKEFEFIPPKYQDPPIFVVVGRISYPKNGVNLFRALALFLEEYGWCPKIIWAGRRDYDDLSVEMYEEMLKVKNTSEKLNGSIEFVGEISDISGLYHRADGLLHFSLYEGLPNVICEAMLFGCIVLASNVCDHPYVLGENMERGLLADPLSAESIKDCLEIFLNLTPEIKLQMASNARLFAEENFDICNMAKAYIE